MVDSDFGLCPDCWRHTPFVAGLTCDTCNVALPGQSSEAEHCDACLADPPPWAQARAPLVYKDRARRLVLGLKHGDRHDIAGPAARWMARVTRPIVTPGMCVAPVPLHLGRLLKRRYNQSALLAAALGRELGLCAIPDLLVRPRATPSLDGKSRVERRRIMTGRISISPKRAHQVDGREVLLVDDVMTSGATLRAATEACLAAGAARVCVSVLARAMKDP